METRIASYLLCEAGRCRDGFALDILFSPSGVPLGGVCGSLVPFVMYM